MRSQSFLADFIKRPSVSQRIFKSVHPNQWLDEETSIEVLNNSDRMFEFRKWVDKVIEDGEPQAGILTSLEKFGNIIKGVYSRLQSP